MLFLFSCLHSCASLQCHQECTTGTVFRPTLTRGVAIFFFFFFLLVEYSIPVLF